MNLKTILASSERCPTGFSEIGPAEHPTKNAATGLLVRNRATGVYMMMVAGAMLSVPHKWAANFAAELGKSPDELQEACIARMAELGLNPNQVAEKTGGNVSRAHVTDFLSRRSSIGSHKLQYVLAALGLKVAADTAHREK